MSSEQPSTHVRRLLEDCLSAARKHDYTLALTAVNDALRARDSDKTVSLINILDHRVAVYLRMDLPDQALKDAKAMIRLDPKDARGYIRSGIAERRKNNKTAAMRYFEYGLKKVPKSDANHALLVKEIKETTEQIRLEVVLSQAQDPLSVLPFEVVELVLSFLDYRSNVRLLRVSRSWNKIVKSSRPLIETLAFPNSTKQITPRALVAALGRCRTLKTVKLPQLPGTTADYLGRALTHSERYPTLQHFEWRSAERYPKWLPISQYDLRVVIVECSRAVIPIEWVHAVLRGCKSLDTAKFKHVSGPSGIDIQLRSDSLRELELHSGGSAYFDSDRISFDCPQLRVLSYLRHMTKLRNFHLIDARLPSIALPTSPRQVQLVSCFFLVQSSVPELPLTPLNELEELQVDCDVFPLFLLQSIQQSLPGNLLKFSVTANDQSAGHLTRIMSMPWFQSLKSLRIINPDFISVDGFPYIKSCLALEELRLEQAGSIGAFVSDLIREAAQLRRVTLLHCPNVARDIIPWAKERGVEVEIHQRDIPAAGGRRVVETY
ncbi:hypothetical protein AYO20_05405 [Fonsecaea nubica]|uniref:F-box domain-containing protein n=1 Tax=Fonsecaea nubica TaxID=856822 RepID=A0A178D1Q6_9EURO|nr:hypothetical protein AYO20_05405 [Fonsecaea nubica]OAL35354.1 hypothetical protein AYO20_05405 [Fonsecaea nubica]